MVLGTGLLTCCQFCLVTRCCTFSEFVLVCSNRLCCFYSYGGEGEDEENLDDNADAFDVPAVSGCAGSVSDARSFHSRQSAYLIARRRRSPIGASRWRIPVKSSISNFVARNDRILEVN